MSQLKQLFIYRRKLIAPYINRLLGALDVACYIMASLFIMALIYEHGFRISETERTIPHTIYDITWVIFLISNAARIALDFKQTCKRFNPVTWCTSAMLFSTLLPLIISSEASHPFVGNIMLLLNSRLLKVLLLCVISLLHLSTGVVQMLSRKVSPSAILSASFFIFIFIGSGLLMLPRATVEGISLIDALFMSTSAICVTGLSTVDVATTFTPMGLMFIMLLIQIGGLGVMTLTCFFAMFFMGNSSLHNQVMVSDVISSKSLSSLLSTLLYILGFTFIIEVGGALLIFSNIHGTMGMSLNDEIFFSVFHAISAFCNAGFSTLSENLGAATLMGGHNLFYITITLLIILGSIGFPILVNLYQTLKYHIGRLFKRYVLRGKNERSRVHLYDINTRIVLIMTMALLAIGTLSIAILEWNNGFAAMPTADKLVHSFFNAACPRTAGFSSVAISSFSIQSVLLLMILMIIGGGAQSTAGGIKVNVFAAVLLNLRAILFGRDEVTVFNRELSQDSVRRSNSTLVLYLLIVAGAIFTLTLLEPDASLLAITFEAISALSTVGSSLDLTPTLGEWSKLIIIVLMFVGRVGVLTMASSLIKERKVRKYKYPSGNIIIN